MLVERHGGMVQALGPSRIVGELELLRTIGGWGVLLMTQHGWLQSSAVSQLSYPKRLHAIWKRFRIRLAQTPVGFIREKNSGSLSRPPRISRRMPMTFAARSG